MHSAKSSDGSHYLTKNELETCFKWPILMRTCSLSAFFGIYSNFRTIFLLLTERETHNLRWSTDIKTYCSVIHTKIILFWINSAPILRRQLIFFLFLLGVCLIESIPYKLHFHAKTVKIILSEIVLVAKLSRQCHSRHSMRYSIVTMAIDLVASVQRNLQWSKHPKKVFWDTKTHSRYGFLTFENH